MHWLGVDIGGTNTKVALVDDAGWTVVEQGSSVTDRSGPASTIHTARDVAGRWTARFPSIAGVGVTIPGHFDREAGTASVVPNIPGNWRGVAIRQPFADETELPVTLINDARAFGLAESRLGAATGVPDVVALVLGTGIGAALVIGGRLHLGNTGIASEVGHLVLQDGGPECGCGNRGCLEALARSDVIAREAGTKDVIEAVRLAEAGDRRARQAVENAAHWIGMGLANMVTLLTPQKVVIGGGIAQAGAILLDPIRQHIHSRTPLIPSDTYSVVAGVLGPWAGAIGAAVAAADASPTTA
jgi:glucokinase